MKSFIDFLKEEIDLRGNTGITNDFMRNADRQASQNLGVRVDDPRQLGQYGSQIMQLVARSKQIMFAGNEQQVDERLTKLEQLAKNIILEQYQDILDASEKPVELIIKILRPDQQVSDEIPDMEDVESTPPPRQTELRDPEIKKAVDKKKLLNALNQGEAKATKNIVRYSELVQPGLEEIFGNQANTILQIWLETIDVADKLDWIFPVQPKAQMMKDQPEGMAGACQVKWEKDDEEQDNQDEEEDVQTTQTEDGVQLSGDQEDFDRITIKAVGVDFPMLLHEAVKGIWQLLKSGSIKDDEELAKIIADNTGTFEDEAQDFRYGVAIQGIFRDFIEACKDSDKYTNMNLRVYGKLALDSERGGEFTDGEFLEIFKSMLSSFDLTQDGTRLEFTLNQEKFTTSPAKRQIESIIKEIVDAEKNYEDELSKWEMEQQFGTSSYEEDDDVDMGEHEDDYQSYLKDIGISGSNKPEVEEEEDDIDSLLDKLSAAKTESEKDAIKVKLNKMMESLSPDGQRIYSNEIELILEKKHVRK
jgi:hypothetical protein